MDDLATTSGRRLSRRQLIVADFVGAAIYSVATLAGTMLTGSHSLLPAWGAAGVVAGVAIPVAVRRLWPLAALGFVVPFSLAATFLGVIADPMLATAAVLYVVALTERPRRWVPTQVIGVISIVTLAAAAVGGPVGWQASVPGVVLAALAIVGGAWALGRLVRDRREQVVLTTRELAKRAVTEERLRIARELHDVVAHSMSLITVKAGIANHVLPERPAEAAHALQVIEVTGRNALVEMRQLLGVLRSEEHPARQNGAPGSETAEAVRTPGREPGGPTSTRPARSTELRPTPRLADIPKLADLARVAGVQVHLRVDAGDELSEGLELTVYRIVQEAVTNVVKHAAPAECHVHVGVHPEEVVIEVIDDGPGRHRALPDPRPPDGHGLIGMQERVAMYGGRLTTGPGPDGGFAVVARIPSPAVMSHSSEGAS